MSEFPNSPDLGNQSQSGDSTFENVWVFGKFKYPFDGDNLTIRSINVKEPSAFSKDVTFSGSIDVSGSANITGDFGVDELTARNANITGIVTTSGDFYALGRFRDVNSNPGASGQILSSTGNGVDWIDANTTSVANSINVGVNLDSTNTDQFVSFFGANSGNQPNRVDSDFTYNPSTNLLKIDGTAGGIVPSGAIIMWSGAANAIPTGYVLCNGSNNTPDLRNRFVVGAGSGSNYSVNDTGGADSVTLTVDQIPAHTHTYIDQYVVINNGYRPWPASNNDCAARNVNSGSAGGGQSHENRPPYYALCYIMKT